MSISSVVMRGNSRRMRFTLIQRKSITRQNVPFFLGVPMAGNAHLHSLNSSSVKRPKHPIVHCRLSSCSTISQFLLRSGRVWTNMVPHPLSIWFWLVCHCNSHIRPWKQSRSSIGRWVAWLDARAWVLLHRTFWPWRGPASHKQPSQSLPRLVCLQSKRGRNLK